MHWTEPATSDDSHAALEKTLWDPANQLWSNAALKPSEYSPTVLGLIFLKGAQASRLFLPRQTAKMAVPPSHAAGVVYLPNPSASRAPTMATTSGALLPIERLIVRLAK